MKALKTIALKNLLHPSIVCMGSLFLIGCSSHAGGDSFPEGVGPFDPEQSFEDPNGSNSPGSSGPEANECEEQARRACAQNKHGAHVVFPTGKPVGTCKYGEQVCEKGSWSACKGLVAPKAEDLCNISGDDSNCNGTPNEGCDCVDAQEDRPCGVSDLGICKMGTQSCENGRWSQCKGDVPPKTELCDNQGIDEDCDGKIDLADEDCYCIDGEQKLCTLGLQGDCNLGIMNCSNGAWGECIPRFPRMQHESCESPRSDAFGSAVGDEDCDGMVNNTPTNGKDPIGCQVYMIDEDGDGWGKRGHSYTSNPDDYTFGCFCVGQVPDPRMVPDKKGQANLDCGDCEDGGDLVFPDSTQSYVEPSACLKEVEWSGGAFDYDCNFEEQPSRPALGKCIETEGECSQVHGHWVNTVPACGELGRVAERCASLTPPCELLASFATDTQACK